MGKLHEFIRIISQPCPIIMGMKDSSSENRDLGKCAKVNKL